MNLQTDTNNKKDEKLIELTKQVWEKIYQRKINDSEAVKILYEGRQILNCLTKMDCFKAAKRTTTNLNHSIMPDAYGS